MWAICNFILATGCRTSTLVEVRIGDLDFKAKKITYQHTKNKKAQIVPMSTTLRNVLKEYIRIWRSEVEDDAFLFANIGENRLTPDALRIAFRKFAKKRGVSKTSLHGLRHTFAREWVLNDGSMIGLQKMLGHNTLEMTRKYIKLFADDMAEDFDDYNPLDNLKKASSRKKNVTRSRDFD
jgi:integrase/recombinase XerD